MNTFGVLAEGSIPPWPAPPNRRCRSFLRILSPGSNVQRGECGLLAIGGILVANQLNGRSRDQALEAPRLTPQANAGWFAAHVSANSAFSTSPVWPDMSPNARICSPTADPSADA